MLKAEKLPTDDIPVNELRDICDAINQRNQGQITELSEHATKNSEAHRQKPDQKRIFMHEFEDRTRLAINFEDNEFQKDRRRGTFTRSWERLGGKTQMYTLSKKAHITHRLLHSHRVGETAKAIARSLGANQDLTEAIGELHDIGHAPFGHYFERILPQALTRINREILRTLGLFKHNIHGLHVVDRIETRHGMEDLQGLNLTDQVKHGILSHDGESFVGSIEPDPKIITIEDINKDIQRYIREVIEATASVEIDGIEEYVKGVNEAVAKVSIKPATWEGCIVYMADSLHYIPEDMEDLISLGFMNRSDIPTNAANILGTNSADMINSLINDLNIHSYGKKRIAYSERVATVLLEFKKKFLYPLYDDVNKILRGESNNPNMQIPDSRVLERLICLIDHFEQALREPQKFPNSPINENYFSGGRDKGKYLKAINGSKDQEIYQTIIDYIAGFTDRYFFEISDQLMNS